MSRWTDEEVTILYKEYKKTPIYKLLQKLNRSLNSIYHKACKLGLSDNYRHGWYKSHRSLYCRLLDINYRCNNSNHHAFKDYGERGIRVCDEWNIDIVGVAIACENFVNWALSSGYQSHLTIDRKNNDGHYEPSNCRWVTVVIQNQNKRVKKSSKFIGVCYHKQGCRWEAYLNHNGKKIYLGLFRNEQDAALAYDTYIKHHNLEREINFR